VKNVLIGSKRTAVSPLRFSKRNMLYFLRGAEWWPYGGWRWQGNATNMPACAHERRNSRTATELRLPFQRSATSGI
jgi:hypothetical protein